MVVVQYGKVNSRKVNFKIFPDTFVYQLSVKSFRNLLASGKKVNIMDMVG